MDHLTTFWEKVRKTDGCWLWFGARVRDGYGSMRWNGRSVSTHRVSWMIHNGEIPAGLSVLHRCDVRNCVRPEHLFLGTQTDNMQDATKKGRLYGRRTATGDAHGARTRPESVLRGAANGHASLTNEQVAEIRASYPGQKQCELAVKYGVTSSTIWRVIHGKVYR